MRYPSWESHLSLGGIRFLTFLKEEGLSLAHFLCLRRYNNILLETCPLQREVLTQFSTRTREVTLFIYLFRPHLETCGMREPGGLPSMGLHRVRHDRSDLATVAAAETCGIFIPWPGTEPALLAVKAWNPNHWTTRKLPQEVIFFNPKK